MNFKNPYFLGIISITIIGAILRIYHLDYNAIWGDELFTFLFAQRSFIDIWSSFATDVHPPLFYWLVHVVLLFNQSDFALRVIPCIFGIATIPLMYYLGKEFINEKVGLISALLMCLSTFQIYYAQDARMYTMWLFFFLLSIIVYLKLLKTPNTQNAFIFGILSGICLWVFFYSFIFFALLIVYCIATKTKVFVAILSYIAVTFTLIPSMITIFTTRTSTPVWFGYQGLDVIRGVFYEFFGYYTMNVLLMSILTIVGSLFLWKYDKKKYLFLWFILACSFVISIVVGYKMPMVGRYLIVATPLLYILVAVAMVNLSEMMKKYKDIFFAFLVLVIFLLNIPLLGIYYTTWQKEDLKGFTREISNITSDGDHVIILTDGMVFLHYYNNTTDNTILHTKVHLNELKQIIGCKTTGAVVLPPYDPSGYVEEIEWINENAKSVKMFGKEMKIYIFK